MQENTNIERLREAGVIKAGYEFNPPDTKALERLSEEEVNVLINVYKELGEKFLEKNCPHGIVF